MSIVHSPIVAPKGLLLNVRAGFVAQGTSLAGWCRANGVRRQNAEKALRGSWTGPGAQKLVARLIGAAGVSSQKPVCGGGDD